MSWCSKIVRWTEEAELTDGSEGFGGRKRGMRGTEGAVLEGAFYNGKDTAKFVDSQKWGIDNLQKSVKETAFAR